MNIIEREIAKRKAVLAEYADKLARIEALKAEVATLEVDVANTDAVALENEIAELNAYLPVEHVPEDVVVGE